MKEAADHVHPPKASPPIEDSALAAAAGFFRAAGDVERLRLLAHLRSGEWCVGELASALEEGMSTISQRLKLLRGEGLVRRRREGKHVYYALADDHVGALLGAALAHAAERREP
ncbi:MAG: ArsR/SmtB family transcription factor [Polyangiales bacterium]